MNEDGMAEWFEKVIIPHIYGNTTLIIMYKSSIHTKFNTNNLEAKFTQELEDKEIEADVLFIPSGLTSVLQPCDNGLIKLLKDKVTAQFIDWLIKNKGNADGVKV